MLAEQVSQTSQKPPDLTLKSSRMQMLGRHCWARTAPTHRFVLTGQTVQRAASKSRTSLTTFSLETMTKETQAGLASSYTKPHKNADLFWLHLSRRWLARPANRTTYSVSKWRVHQLSLMQPLFTGLAACSNAISGEPSSSLHQTPSTCLNFKKVATLPFTAYSSTWRFSWELSTCSRIGSSDSLLKHKRISIKKLPTASWHSPATCTIASTWHHIRKAIWESFWDPFYWT